MPRLLTLYLAKRIAVAALLIEAMLCIPLVMTSLFQTLPAAAIRGGLLLPALLGTLPTVLYLALPLSVGVAVALEFSRMSSDGMIAVLYSIRLSVWSLCAPVLIVAVAAVSLGYALSSYIAPSYVGQMHDVIHVIRNSLNHRMLEPAHFYTFDKGARTMFFQRWRSSDVASGMFIYQYSAEKNEEQIINAEEAEFRRNEQGVVIVLNHGSIQTLPSGAQAMRNANFEQYALPIDMQGAGALPKRDWRGVFELPLGDFFAALPPERWDPRGYAEWMSEAAKRCFIPILALTHALLAVGLVLTVAAATGRGSAATTSTILAIPLIHVGILVGSESIVRENPHLIWLIGLAIAAELGLALFLIARRNAKFGAVEPPELLPAPA
ncbi:LptF/LptG family permease [Methylocella silvestris]|uniref:Permease n=1 Tax=Methylocella silvestris TaxID=199596 RepID=A0A2J7TJ66_METSI|nr:LptF/LptG family permease [Methylocella silvestris]PNG26814.1 permease [Methylocella silvestris]